ncbi:MAG: tRNA uridine(34) 5-carboxymethylaminomethyl modification radical SAM/GNAT enzyme Elp3 [Candidatus Pacearchaeota archaeon]|nr:tRNA uridine(34) 5-carboxymethylaminomethyl modification radical SAM/GNAT enzyme Elp3 [Candidatus Pacearchaeota archaeon]
MLLPKSNEVRKPSKTMAGVTPIAVMCKPRKCKHGTCLYCPSLEVPQSYTPLSPPVIRAIRLEYSPLEQVKSRLKAFNLMNHPTNKIELIIMGGTFLSYPLNYQYSFIKACYDALNEKISRSLEQAKKLNEKAKHRCVALCIETRPDFCSDKQIARMLEFGCTRVELGVQAIDDNIYKKINRGHTVKDVILATKRLKDSGFKVGFHVMPGIPFSNPKKDLGMFRKLFSNQDFKPDQLKIYPCQVIKGSKLESLYNQGKFKPYSKEQIQSLLIKMMKIVPEYCRVMRIMREIPPNFLIAGTTRIDLRKDVELEIRKKNFKINEIRFREIGFNLRDSKKPISRKLKLKISTYQASKGKEYFLQFVNKDNILFGLLRLRIIKEQKIAFVRELHVYGQTLAIGAKPSIKDIQHKGLGKALMKAAEDIAKKEKINLIKVISGAGAREYYKKLCYKLENEYMVKRLN